MIIIACNGNFLLNGLKEIVVKSNWKNIKGVRVDKNEWDFNSAVKYFFPLFCWVEIDPAKKLADYRLELTCFLFLAFNGRFEKSGKVEGMMKIETV